MRTGSDRRLSEGRMNGVRCGNAMEELTQQNIVENTALALPICFSIRPTHWTEHSSQPRNRANENQHGKCHHKNKARFHIVQYRDHLTPLLLLELPTLPSTFTNPWAHRISLVKSSATTRTLTRPRRSCFPEPLPYPLSVEILHNINYPAFSLY